MLERVARIVAPSEKTLGIYVNDLESAREWVDSGARYIATGTDGFLRKGMRGYLDGVRS